MPNIKYYDDVKIIKKPIKYRIKSFFIFLFILLVVVGCFFSATYLSSALTVGNISNLIVYGSTNIKYDKSSMYAVILGKYLTFKEAEEVALGSTIQGASGYVWEDNNEYFVVGNIYSKEDDANNVAENLVSSKYSVEVKEIIFPKVNLTFDMYDNSNMGIIKSAFSIFNDIYSELYNYSLSFDKGEITHLAVSSYISQLRGEVKSLIVSVQNLINKSNSSLNVVQNYLIKLDETLEQAIIKTIDNTSTNYSLKNAIVNVVRFKYEMFNELAV